MLQDALDASHLLLVHSAALGRCLAWPASPPVAQGRPYLEAAVNAAKWVRASGTRTDSGLTWPADPADPRSTGTTLDSGSPGVVLFMLELHHAGTTGIAYFLARVYEEAKDRKYGTGPPLGLVVVDQADVPVSVCDRLQVAGARERCVSHGLNCSWLRAPATHLESPGNPSFAVCYPCRRT